MAVGAGVAGEVDEHQLVFGARFGERFLVLVLHPDRRRGFAAATEQRDAFGLHGNERFHIAERCAEQSGQQADGEHQEQRGHQHAADAQMIFRFDSFQAQEAEQIKTGQREEHHPGSQEHFARDPVGLQDLIGRAQVLHRDGEHHESQHHFHAHQPAAALGQLLQERRK